MAEDGQSAQRMTLKRVLRALSRHRKGSIAIGVAALLLAGGMGVAADLGIVGHPNPDPGGRILAVLESAGSAVPSGAHVSVSQAYEPQWDSCDGMSGTFGYGAAYFDLTFETSMRSATVIQRAEQLMRKRGWSLRSASVDAPHGAIADWRERLYNGKIATTELVFQLGQSPQVWQIYGQAPPAAGAATHGC